MLLFFKANVSTQYRSIFRLKYTVIFKNRRQHINLYLFFVLFFHSIFTHDIYECTNMDMKKKKTKKLIYFDYINIYRLQIYSDLFLFSNILMRNDDDDDDDVVYIDTENRN